MTQKIQIIKNWGIVGLFAVIAILLMKNCGNSQLQPIAENAQIVRIDTFTKINTDTLYIPVPVEVENQTIEKVFIEVEDKEAQKEIDELKSQLLAYQKELETTGKITKTKTIHNLQDSIKNKYYSFAYDIEAEGKIYPPKFNLEIYKADTVTTVQQLFQPKKKWQLGISGGYANNGGHDATVFGVDLSKGWFGIGTDYIAKTNLTDAVWTAKVRVSIEF